MSGIIRHLDNVNRITLPIEWRKQANFEAENLIEISFDGEKFTLKQFIKENHSNVYGQLRILDDLGRVIIPKDWCMVNGISCRDSIEINYDDDKKEFTLRKVG